MEFKLIDTQIEVNEDFIDFDSLYDIYYDGKLNFEARLIEGGPAPKLLKYRMNKDMDLFTPQEKIEILAYRGLTINDESLASDVFMHGNHITLLK